jgi:uncharacterized membrane protein YccC
VTARWSDRLLAKVNPRRRIRDAITLSGRGREGMIQAAKMALAAVVAWSVALLFDRQQPFIAAYAAVFMMSGTVYRSLLDGVRQVTTVILGVLVAFGAVLVIPWPPAELGAAVFVGMVIGRWHRLGRDGIWVGVVALLMVTYGTADDTSYLALRVAEALLGATVGVAVNALILPPLTLRDAGRAVAAVSGEIAELLESITRGLRDGWDEGDARRWRRTGRQLGTAVRHAEEAVGHGRESMRLNPRRLWSPAARPVVEQREPRTLYEITQHVQQLTEALFTAAEPDNALPTTGSAFDTQLAALLDTLAEAVRVYREPDTRSLDRPALATALDRARDRRAALAGLVPWPDHEPPKDWSTHAAVMLAVERALRTLLDAADPGSDR